MSNPQAEMTIIEISSNPETFKDIKVEYEQGVDTKIGTDVFSFFENHQLNKMTQSFNEIFGNK